MTDTSVIFSRFLDKKLRGRIHKQRVIWTSTQKITTHIFYRETEYELF